MKSHPRRVLAVWVAIVALLALGGVGAWQARRARLAAALVDEVLAAVAEVPKREPIFQPPRAAGTVVDCLLSQHRGEPRLRWFGAAPPDAGVSVAAVLRGDSPARQLPGEAWDELDAGLAWADEVVDCARHPTVRTQEQYVLGEPPMKQPLVPAKLVGLAAVAAVERGAPTEALDRCARLVALSADQSAMGLLGAMLGSATVRGAAAWCGAAVLAVEPPAPLEAFVEHLERARGATLPVAAVLRHERNVMLLALYLPSFPQEQLLRLPQRLRTELDAAGLGFDQPFAARLLSEAAWPQVRARFDQQVAAAAVEPTARSAAFAALKAAPQPWLLTLPPVSLLDVDYEQYVRRRAETDEMVEQLIALAQHRLGRRYDGPSRTLTVGEHAVTSTLNNVKPLPLRTPPAP